MAWGKISNVSWLRRALLVETIPFYWTQQCDCMSLFWSVNLCVMMRDFMLSASFIQAITCKWHEQKLQWENWCIKRRRLHTCLCSSSFRAPAGSVFSDGTSTFSADVNNSKAFEKLCSYVYNSAWRPMSSASIIDGVDVNSVSGHRRRTISVYWAVLKGRCRQRDTHTTDSICRWVSRQFRFSVDSLMLTLTAEHSPNQWQHHNSPMIVDERHTHVDMWIWSLRRVANNSWLGPAVAIVASDRLLPISEAQNTAGPGSTNGRPLRSFAFRPLRRLAWRFQWLSSDSIGKKIVYCLWQLFVFV